MITPPAKEIDVEQPETAEKIIQRGQDAKRLMADPVLQAALENLRSKQLRAIEQATIDQPEQRNAAFYMIKAIQALKTELNSMVGDAAMEQHKLERATKLEKGKRK